MYGFDPSKFVPQNYPEISFIKSQGCPPRNTSQLDYTKGFFCKSWGDSFDCICPPKKDLPQFRQCPHPQPIPPQSEIVRSLDYFSVPPSRPLGSYLGEKSTYVPMAKKYGLQFEDPCPKRELGFSTECHPGSYLKPDFIHGDSICGTCTSKPRKSFANGSMLTSALNKSPFVCEDDFPGYDISSNLPFKVCFTQYPKPEPIKIRTGVERALHPSSYHEITSTYQETYRDFVKLKTKKQLALYKSPLVIDCRRARRTLEADPNPSLVLGVNNGPLYVSAKPIRWKSRVRRCPPCLDSGLGFKIELPGPICLI